MGRAKRGRAGSSETGINRINFRHEIAGEKLAIGIAQDYKTKEVLMVGFINKESLEKSLKTKLVHYFSTSRKKLWKKGEESGHVQKIKEVRIDCDGDAVLFLVEQKTAACHEGYRSCFFRKLKGGKFGIAEKKVFEPSRVYK